MQLLDLLGILANEARSSRGELLSQAELLADADDGSVDPALMEEAAAGYADFCNRAAAASDSLGLGGLSQMAVTLAEGLGMAAALPLELRNPAGPLLKGWPDFFVGYLEGWGQSQLPHEAIEQLLGHVAAAEYITPLEADALAALRVSLLNPSTLSAQQAALTPAFEPLLPEAFSLAYPEDADAGAIEGFLADAPGLIDRLAAVVRGLTSGENTAATLETAHRAAHTLKGNAAIAGVRGVATLAHALEDLMEVFRQSGFVPPYGLHEAMAEGCNQLEAALDHLTQQAEAPDDFAAVGRVLHAWAGRLQGQSVADEDLELPSGAQVVSVITSNAPAPATPDAQDDDVQIRVPAKALDRIYKAVNELAVGLLRLRNQTDDVMARTGAMAQLEVTANQRLLEIERHIQEQGLGRQRAASSAAVGHRVSGLVPAALSEFDALELDHYNELTGSTQALGEALLDVRVAREDVSPALRDIGTLVQRQLQFARDAQYHVAQARLRPLSDLRSRLRRTVRQTCAAVGRDAALEISGDHLRVDAAVLSPLAETLLHLLRNSVDHGIEPPEARLASGKPAQGTIRLAFSAQGGGIVAELTDDGQGLDHAAILDKATWAGLVSPDAQLTTAQVARLIFLPGFSTRSDVTETSGRGVGLDAVTQAIASLQGNISVDSTQGQGTRFRMFVLASVGTLHALHIECKGEHFLVPSVQLDRAEAAPVMAGGETQAADAPTVSLLQLLHGHHLGTLESGQAHQPSLLVRVDDTLQRIRVDQILEAREFTVMQAPALVSRMPGMNGIATLSDGSLAIVLDLIDLARRPLPLQQAGLQQLQSTIAEQSHILVVDDSTSVRNTLGALLRDANYRVTTARDGLEAMRILTEQSFSLVLTDLEMPQLNGLELTEFIRGRSLRRNVPVVMLTSRGQDKHRSRAREAGVDAFLVKPYADQDLLDQIHQLLQIDRAVADPVPSPAFFPEEAEASP